jgi:hypothetical protein
MKAGGGKAKGANFEREVCVKLSRWVSQGKKTDLYWRSAMSGGRATVIHRQGGTNRQAGDITAVATEGHTLTDKWYIECKHVRDLNIDTFIVSGRGMLADFWRTANKEAIRHGKVPMLIARQNRFPTIVVTRPDMIYTYALGNVLDPKTADYICLSHEYEMWLFDDLLKLKFHGRVRLVT